MSSGDQRADLDRQVARLAQWGTGLNGKRPKLRRILSDPCATVVLVEHRDRLARFGVEYLEAALSAQGRRIVVADPAETSDDLARDMIEVVDVDVRMPLRPARCAQSGHAGADRGAAGAR